MAKKSKGFTELLRQEREDKIEQHSMNQLKRKLRTNRFGQQVAEMVMNPEGMDKMSEVLKAFVEPYWKTVKNSNQRQTFLEIAVFAWNLSLKPEKERQSLLEEMIGHVTPRDNFLVQRDFKEIIKELITRKLKLFPDNHRLIVEFHLQESPNQFHLSVASTVLDSANSV